MDVSQEYIDELKAAEQEKKNAEAAEQAKQAAIEAKRNMPKIVIISTYSLKFSGFKQFGRKF